jgi:hypothetical protein
MVVWAVAVVPPCPSQRTGPILERPGTVKGPTKRPIASSLLLSDGYSGLEKGNLLIPLSFLSRLRVQPELMTVAADGSLEKGFLQVPDSLVQMGFLVEDSATAWAWCRIALLRISPRLESMPGI